MRPTSERNGEGMAPEGPEEPVLTGRTGRLAHLTLNRPRVLNALTHPMVRIIDAALARWEHDEGVAAVVIAGAGERGLCAGGDIRAVHEDARTGGVATPAFWRDEYLLNARIARYPKPYAAIMDGITMGGGVGLSRPCRFRVATERTTFAMPETGIGLFPDVGGGCSWARTAARRSPVVVAAKAVRSSGSSPAGTKWSARPHSTASAAPTAPPVRARWVPSSPGARDSR